MQHKSVLPSLICLPLLLALSACAESDQSELVYQSLEDVADASAVWTIERDFSGEAEQAQQGDVDSLQSAVTAWAGECGRVTATDADHFTLNMLDAEGCEATRRRWAGETRVSIEREEDQGRTHFEYALDAGARGEGLSGRANLAFVGVDRVFTSDLSAQVRGERHARVLSRRVELAREDGARLINGTRIVRDCEGRVGRGENCEREEGDARPNTDGDARPLGPLELFDHARRDLERAERDDLRGEGRPCVPVRHEYIDILLREGEVVPRSGTLLVVRGRRDLELTFESVGEFEVLVRAPQGRRGEGPIEIRVDPRTGEWIEGPETTRE